MNSTRFLLYRKPPLIYNYLTFSTWNTITWYSQWHRKINLHHRYVVHPTSILVILKLNRSIDHDFHLHSYASSCILKCCHQWKSFTCLSNVKNKSISIKAHLTLSLMKLKFPKARRGNSVRV